MIAGMGQTFLSGVLFILPIFISVYVLFWLAGGLDRLFNNILSGFSAEYALPQGLGFVLGAVIIYIMGLSTELLISKWFSRTIEKVIKKIPFVGAIFESLKNLADYLNPHKQHNKGASVAVTLPGSNIKLLGFLTRSNLSQFPKGLNDPDRVAVYIPMSYMMGGMTVFVPKNCIEVVDLPFDKAMPGILTAWVQNDTNEHKGTQP